jgi:SAM-dependent methyltransferase
MTAPTTATTPSHQLLDLITGYWVSQAIYTAAKLGIADLLKGGPRTAADLARTAEVDEEALYRLLRALAGKQIFQEVGDRRFALTPLAELLREDHPLSLRPLSVMFCGLQYHAWGDILHSVRTGKCAYEHQTGQPFFDYLAADSAAALTFSRAMTSFLQSIPKSVVEVYDFAPFRKIVDVGAATGTLLAAILKAHTQARGVLFDQPHVMDKAREAMAAEGLSARCEFVGGDFFASVPRGGDAYILSTILHDWDDERCLAILRNCREAISPGGKLLLVEMVIKNGNDPFFGKWLDLHMLVMHGGHDRTEAEYAHLLRSAGFQLNRVIPTNFLRSVVEAAPV